MKKLLFLIPIGAWIASYFIWQYSIPFLGGETPGVISLWWGLTDCFISLITIGTFIYAFAKNTE